MMQLLAVGRSLSEMRDRPHRYKLVANGMPKLDAEASAVERSGAGQVVAGESNIQTAGAAQTMITETAEARPARQAFPRGRWTLKANPFKSSYKPAARQSVQGELSLDHVKPVRNDLSDSDLELIPRKVARFVEAKPENVFAGHPAGGVKGPSLLERLKARLLRGKAK